MAESNFSELPNWVSKRDGRLVAFDADEICQTIFAGTEEMRQPNAFLAREMTESVLHFLAQEHGAGTPTTAQIAELMTKVLRELGQTDLAQAVYKRAKSVSEPRQGDKETRRQGEENDSPCLLVSLSPCLSPAQFVDQCRRAFSLQAVFSRDVVAAQDEGWLTLVGLEHPAELEGGVVDWPGEADRSLLSALVQARRRFGSFIALDSPEQALPLGPQSERHVANFIGDLKEGLQATGLHVVINLNVAQPPAWVEQPGDGPLFGRTEDRGRRTEEGNASLALALLERLLSVEQIRVDWHLGERDFAAASQDNLLKVVRTLGVDCEAWTVDRGPWTEDRGPSSRPTVHGPPATFVFDRPRMPVALGEGLDRRHPAVLQVAGLHLAPLVDMPGVEGNVEVLLQKLLHLTRMAVSTGTQKRNFLRRQAEHQSDLQRGFFLDRARLAVIPVGLAAVVQRDSNRSLSFREAQARQIVQRLRQCLVESGRSANLEAVLDSPWWTVNRGPWTVDRGPWTVDHGSRTTDHGPRITDHGLTWADFTLPAEDQLRAAGMLHQLTGTGTATLLVPAERPGR